MTKKVVILTRRQLNAVQEAREARLAANAAAETATVLFRKQVEVLAALGLTNRKTAELLGVTCSAVNKELHR